MKLPHQKAFVMLLMASLVASVWLLGWVNKDYHLKKHRVQIQPIAFLNPVTEAIQIMCHCADSAIAFALKYEVFQQLLM